jgi:hypothetical protein
MIFQQLGSVSGQLIRWVVIWLRYFSSTVNGREGSLEVTCQSGELGSLRDARPGCVSAREVTCRDDQAPESRSEEPDGSRSYLDFTCRTGLQPVPARSAAFAGRGADDRFWSSATPATEAGRTTNDDRVRTASLPDSKAVSIDPGPEAVLIANSS